MLCHRLGSGMVKETGIAELMKRLKRCEMGSRQHWVLCSLPPTSLRAPTCGVSCGDLRDCAIMIFACAGGS